MVCICLSLIVAGKMAAPRGLYLFVAYCCRQDGDATWSVFVFVTYCSRQDGGATWSVFVCHIILQARWRHHVVCICLLHIVVGKKAAPRGLYLFVIYRVAAINPEFFSSFF